MGRSGKALGFSVGVCALAQAASPAFAAVERYQSEGWALSVQHDSFSGRTSCALESVNRRLVYQADAIGFLLGRHRSTIEAWYRVDGGVPVKWQDREPVLIASGAQIDGPGLDDPTGGWVWIPGAELGQAKEIAIRPNDRSRVRRYKLVGFVSMLEASRRLGCVSYGMLGS